MLSRFPKIIGLASAKFGKELKDDGNEAQLDIDNAANLSIDWNTPI